MSIGTNIRTLREERKFTQEQVAEAVGVTFQAVSSWERDEYKPDTEKLIRLADLLDVSISSIAEEKRNPFRTKETIYNWEHMKTYVKATAKSFRLNNTLKAVDYAVEAHEGQRRKRSATPYIYHPLNLACHALAMNITEDEVIAACMLHDVIEDCGKKPEDLPVNDETKELVRLLTHGSEHGETPFFMTEGDKAFAAGLIPELGRSPGGRNGNPLSCLGNHMEPVHVVIHCRTQLSTQYQLKNKFCL